MTGIQHRSKINHLAIRIYKKILFIIPLHRTLVLLGGRQFSG